MRVSRPLFTAFLLIMLLALSSSALANSVTMTFIGGTPNGTGGGATYPYYVSINGSSSLTALMCDSYDNIVSKGESWQANVTSLLSGQGLFGSSLLNYKAAGLIFKDILRGQISTVAGNWAIWGLFSSSAQSDPLFLSTGAAGIDSDYLALAATAPQSDFKGLVLYTPIRGTQSVGGLPQEFIGVTTVPEPGTLTLLGTGLVGLLGAVRKKLARG